MRRALAFLLAPAVLLVLRLRAPWSAPAPAPPPLMPNPCRDPSSPVAKLPCAGPMARALDPETEPSNLSEPEMRPKEAISEP